MREEIARQMDAMLESYREMRSKLDDTRSAVGDIQVTATNPDRTVTVTVASGGRILDLELSPEIYRRPDPATLARVILETIGSAQHRLAEQVSDHYRHLFGPSFDVNSVLTGDQDALKEQIRDTRRHLFRD